MSDLHRIGSSRGEMLFKRFLSRRDRKSQKQQKRYLIYRLINWTIVNVPVRGTSRAIVIPRELFRKSTLAYSRPIKSRSCQKLPTPQPPNRGSPRRRTESRAWRVGLMNNSLCVGFSVLWRLTTGWRRFSDAGRKCLRPPARTKDESANRRGRNEGRARSF